MDKRVIITGATGFIGQELGRHLAEAGCEVIGLTRSAEKNQRTERPRVKLVPWDGCTAQGWADYADGAYAIVNLAGENVGSGRWTKQKKTRILDSRLNAAQAVVEAVKLARQKPQVVIQASAIGYYGDSGDQSLDEESPAGSGFLADVCRQWERAIKAVADMGVRLGVVRIGVVLGAEGGMLKQVLPIYRKFLGGCPGSGSNWMSWIHIQDVVGAVKFLMEKSDAHGAFNLTAPQPVVAKEFYQLLGSVMHRPALVPVPAFALKMLLGEMAQDLLLAGQRALPEKLLDNDYKFQFPQLKSALQSVLKYFFDHY
ncbi:MAG: hypothetical protein AMJ79_05995 [Phycisphaerae bacterium SM23_30]|nr:MAG: hypothetical protein AMJ79_05995 [Phycisphaerae bacterium SM23_30]